MVLCDRSHALFCVRVDACACDRTHYIEKPVFCASVLLITKGGFSDESIFHKGTRFTCKHRVQMLITLKYNMFFFNVNLVPL